MHGASAASSPIGLGSSQGPVLRGARGQALRCLRTLPRPGADRRPNAPYGRPGPEPVPDAPRKTEL
eukprot:14086343-Alexandrium_andersonii.AAC.1